MDSEGTNALILGKLEDLSKGQNEIEKNIATILERIDQRDKQYCDQFEDIRTDIKKGYDGRTVLHQKQDELNKKLEQIQPEISFVKGVMQNVNKIIGWAVIIILTGVLLTSLPKIIEVLK